MKFVRSCAFLIPFVRFALFYVLFFSTLTSSLSAYGYPPHELVSGHNNALAPSLLGSSCAEESNPDYDDPIACAEIELVSVYPSVDSRISADKDTYALWRYAHDASSEDRIVTGADGCTSYYHKTYQGTANIYANLSVFFRNSTYFLDNITGNNPVPLPITRATLNATQGDNLTAIVSGKITFHYILDKTIGYQSCDGNGSCTCLETVYPSEPMNITRSVSSNLSYEVEGGSLLHFLSKPVLREQWEKNSQFEDIVFSKRKFHSAALLMNNLVIGNATFYAFNITNDSYGVWRIISFPVSNFTNMSGNEMEVRTTPIPLEEANDSFVLLYVFKSSYSAFGPHNLDLAMHDHFGNTVQQTFGITNRRHTFGNSSGENGEQNISDRDFYRPSAQYMTRDFTLLTAGLGTIGALILVLVLFRR